jgi:hypothetical protein
MPTCERLARARRGAALLDKKLGRGWRRTIRRRQLNMQSGYMEEAADCGCIVTQLDFALEGDGVGLYSRGCERLGWPETVRYGFDQRTHDEDAWDDLGEAWLVVLREGDRR